MIAINRCTCKCTDGCISENCACKIATFKEFCRFNNISEQVALDKGYPKGGWYQNDLLQGLDTSLPYQKQLRLFECCKGKKISQKYPSYTTENWIFFKECACMKHVTQLNEITCRNTLAYDGCRNMSFMISESITSFKENPVKILKLFEFLWNFGVKTASCRQ